MQAGLQFLRLLIVFAANASCFPLWHSAEPQYDLLCTVDNRAFTGIRILHERLMYIPSFATAAKQTVVVECSLGRELYRLHSAANTTVFNLDLDVPDNMKLRLVRQPVYAGDEKLRYVSGTVVGAAYKSHDGGKSWVPLTPLIADFWDKMDHEVVGHGASTEVHVMTSLLRSPDVLEKTYSRTLAWAEKIPVYEYPANTTESSMG